ncbi:MAG: hypothetical protein ACM30I_02245 [Gemmatimonas sp.]
MTTMPKIPKIRQRADIVLADGTTLSGFVFVEATMRIQDLLNAPTDFFPFVDGEEVVHLINKRHVAHVRPRE